MSLRWIAVVSFLLPSFLFAAEPVATWKFNNADSSPASYGSVAFEVPGPRPPDFPDFSQKNVGVRLNGSAYLSIADQGDESQFDFKNGDQIAIAAWINPTKLRQDQNSYIIGKGRTGEPNFLHNNQNWALRIRGIQGEARASFLFATEAASGKSPWHRWTSKVGVVPGTGWHQMVVSYEFGKPQSVRCWINGKRIEGSWDMGGPTEKAPIVDNAPIWIGSALGGSASNSFYGELDHVSLYRTTLDDNDIQKSYKRVGEPPKIVKRVQVKEMPKLGMLPGDKVSVTIREGMPEENRWLFEDESLPPLSNQMEVDAFLLHRMPLHYDSWGIRDAWKTPVLVRLAADVKMPAGKHRILFRSATKGRLWIDGKLIAETRSVKQSPGSNQPMTPVAKPPYPGVRRAAHMLRESFGNYQSDRSSTVRVVAEVLVGGKKFRAETGELIVAIDSADQQMFHILQSHQSSEPELPLEDEAIESQITMLEKLLTDLDDTSRRQAATSRDKYWLNRHDLAKAWVKDHPAPQSPSADGSRHPIDAFIEDRIHDVKRKSEGSKPKEVAFFHEKVLPILRSECFRCHADKESGGLRLDDRESALLGGYSGEAVVPHDPENSELMRRVLSDSEEEQMPPTGKPLRPADIAILKQWIKQGASWPELPFSGEETQLAKVIDDEKFLRRIYIDTVGELPTERDVQEFLADKSSSKRQKLIRNLLEDPRVADNWMGYWQDLLAENPTMINNTLNSTGPFRWFLYESLRDQKSMDQMVTELLLMRGSTHDGGSAGFALAAHNDSPFAAKGHIMAGAFLGIDLSCARCHDAPYHSTTQKDLYSLAAMFDRKPLKVPASSSVPAAFFEEQDRASLIEVTLQPGVPVKPEWAFADVTGIANDENLDQYLENKNDTRERLAALVTAPENERFAKTIVNRVWRRLIGTGIVEPPNDWERGSPSHDALLTWLARDFVANEYSLQHLMQTIMTSRIYQQEAVGKNRTVASDRRLFNAPDRRRMSAEQIVDSYYSAVGKKIDVEQMSLDPAGQFPRSGRNSFGKPRRAWMLASTSNERDRPSLTLPRSSVLSDVMTAFGWSAERQKPITDREADPNVLQPAIIANGTLTVWLTRASSESLLADLAVEAKSPEALVDTIFLRLLSRMPSEAERALFAKELASGFATRVIAKEDRPVIEKREVLPQVTWANHLRPEANMVQLEHARRARIGPPADPRLKTQWREVYEDVVWSIVNLREFVWIP